MTGLLCLIKVFVIIISSKIVFIVFTSSDLIMRPLSRKTVQHLFGQTVNYVYTIDNL